MKIFVQFAKKNADGWREIDSAEWRSLANKGIPARGQLGDDATDDGWLCNVSVQGITSEGFDHVAVEPVQIGNDEGVRYTLWNDDPDDQDLPNNDPQAMVWTILPLAPDPKLGMAINTRQSCVRYATGERYKRHIANPIQNTTVRPFSEFVPPDEAITRHGVWLSDQKFAEHTRQAPQSDVGWRRWCDHLPESETEIHKGVRILKDQRATGRYKKPEHTITYYQRDTARALAGIAATNENALELTTGSATTQSVTTNAGAVTGWAFTSPSGSPNSGAWPAVSGAGYHAQFDVTAASSGLVYGQNYVGTSGSMFNRADSSPSLVETKSPAAGDSGTGLKLFTIFSSASDWSGESSSDRYVVVLTVQGDSHGDAITIRVNTTDSYADGPWSTGTQFTQNLGSSTTAAGGLVKQAQPRKTGSVTAGGVAKLSKLTFKALAGSVSIAGALRKLVDKILAGSSTPAATLQPVRLFIKDLEGAINPTGNLVKDPRQVKASSTTAAGSIVKATSKPLSASLTPSGILAAAKQAAQTLTASVTSAGSIVNLADKRLSGSSQPSGTLAVVSSFFRMFTGSITAAGSLRKDASKQLAGSSQPSGAIAAVKSLFQSLAGSVSAAGAIAKLSDKRVSGSAAADGGLLKEVARRETGDVSLSGSLRKDVAIVKGGSTTASGALSTLKVALQTLAGSVTSSGTVQKAASIVRGGSVAIAGTLQKFTSLFRSGAVSPSGGTTNQQSGTSLTIAGSVTPSGAIARSTAKLLAGQSTITAMLTRSTSIVRSGEITALGSLARVKLASLQLTSSVLPSGAVRNFTNKRLAGSISATGTLVRSISKLLGGLINAAGNLVTQFQGVFSVGSARIYVSEAADAQIRVDSPATIAVVPVAKARVWAEVPGE